MCGDTPVPTFMRIDCHQLTQQAHIVEVKCVSIACIQFYNVCVSVDIVLPCFTIVLSSPDSYAMPTPHMVRVRRLSSAGGRRE